MKGAALLAILLWQAAAANEPPVAQPGAMRYERAIHLAGGERQGGAGQACAVLDAAIFPHAAPSLTDVRIFPAQEAAAGAAVHEVPYAITLSEAASEETETARVLNLGASGAKIVFDLEMPERAYTGVTLDLDPAVHDFIATATVSGSDALGGRGGATALGTFTLFDLASQRLSRDTTIPLQESTFKFLHVELSVSSAPGSAAARFVPAMVRGAQVPPSREAQSLYTMVAETASIATKGRESVATFAVPARIPVERVSFVFAPGFTGNFSREVRVSALEKPDKSDDDGRAPLPEVVTGSILRVHASEAGREISTEQLGVPAILGANLQRAAKVEVAIENGDDQPLPIAAVRLEMRQRKICFDAPAGGAEGKDSGLALFYGDSRLDAPEYDYARLFVASRAVLAAELGPERLNPNYRAPAAPLRPFTERHPELLWIALIAAICALGVVALRAAKSSGLG
ncbi:MAG: DUF3999 family protein [Acidobacteriaceae bacterium]